MTILKIMLRRLVVFTVEEHSPISTEQSFRWRSFVACSLAFGSILDDHSWTICIQMHLSPWNMKWECVYTNFQLTWLVIVIRRMTNTHAINVFVPSGVIASSTAVVSANVFMYSRIISIGHLKIADGWESLMSPYKQMNRREMVCKWANLFGFTPMSSSSLTGNGLYSASLFCISCRHIFFLSTRPMRIVFLFLSRSTELHFRSERWRYSLHRANRK